MRIRAIQSLCGVQKRLLTQSLQTRNSYKDLLDLFETTPIPKPREHSKRVLILSPEEVKDKVVTNLIKEKKEKTNALSRIPANELEESLLASALPHQEALESSNIVEAVEYFKPLDPGSLSAADIANIANNLATGFKKAQLIEYLQTKGSRSPPKHYTKNIIGQFIIKEIWKTKLKDELSFHHLKKEIIHLSEQELFYLHSQNGQLLHTLKLTLTDLELDSKKGELTLHGTEKQVHNAQVYLSSQFGSAYEIEVDLSTVKRLYQEKLGHWDIQKIGAINDVFFKKIVDERYRICSLKSSSVKRMNRLLMWYLNYNIHQKNILHLPSENELKNCSLIQHLDVSSSTWVDRKKSQFQLINEESNSSVSSRLKSEWESYDSINLENLDINEEPGYNVTEFEPVADETFELLERLGLLTDEMNKDGQTLAGTQPVRTNQDDPASIENQINIKKPVAQPLLLETERLELYSKLLDFSYRLQLRGLSNANTDSSVFTITLGKTIFEKDADTENLFSSAPSKEKLEEAFSFNTNVPLIYDQALSLSLVGEYAEIQNDPHQNFLQFKFLPSPFVPTDSGSADTQMMYPPIELWTSLTENSVADIETLQLVTVEGENNAFVCLPSLRSDLKITAQITGQILEQTPENNTVDPAVDTTDILGATADKFSRLQAQPGVKQFLTKLKFNFNKNEKTTIAPTMKVIIGGKEIEYMFLSLRHRRELTLETEDNKPVQLSIIDGGLLSGRRVEVRLIGDTAAGLSRDNFDDLIDHASDLVRAL